jgi:hypothetical protein
MINVYNINLPCIYFHLTWFVIVRHFPSKVQLVNTYKVIKNQEKNKLFLREYGFCDDYQQTACLSLKY